VFDHDRPRLKNVGAVVVVMKMVALGFEQFG